MREGSLSKMSRYRCTHPSKQRVVAKAKAFKVCLIKKCPFLKVGGK